jgi:hypothetical protein
MAFISTPIEHFVSLTVGFIALDGASTVKNGNAHARFARGTGTMSIMEIHLRPKQ